MSQAHPNGHPQLLRCLIVGAGEAGAAMARELRRVPSFGLQPVGFLDDNPTQKRVQGLHILEEVKYLQGCILTQHGVGRGA